MLMRPRDLFRSCSLILVQPGLPTVDHIRVSLLCYLAFMSPRLCSPPPISKVKVVEVPHLGQELVSDT